eukprot:CAMPEP_0198117352 /NCGR_PEP_ID=MMETSP1442-20131203/17789_1 /TAXON_ID= /ORGANISM="Craspedostauros australis, Strain CCMP3328" /LENGTH=88 /DNA_ID=CAMNT_0043775385 /DNA_START=1 /DNA_END=267 /DNA_ORIENTATION=-
MQIRSGIRTTPLGRGGGKQLRDGQRDAVDNQDTHCATYLQQHALDELVTDSVATATSSGHTRAILTRTRSDVERGTRKSRRAERRNRE